MFVNIIIRKRLSGCIFRRFPGETPAPYGNKTTRTISPESKTERTENNKKSGKK